MLFLFVVVGFVGLVFLVLVLVSCVCAFCLVDHVEAGEVADCV